MNDLIVIVIVLIAVAFVIHCPILKPWFGFRKPEGHRGKWFE